MGNSPTVDYGNGASEIKYDKELEKQSGETSKGNRFWIWFLLHSSRRHHAAISNERVVNMKSQSPSRYMKSCRRRVELFHFNGRKWHMGHHLITLTHSFEACSHIKPTGTIFHLHFQHFVRALFVFVEFNLINAQVEHASFLHTQRTPITAASYIIVIVCAHWAMNINTWLWFVPFPFKGFENVEQ